MVLAQNRHIDQWNRFLEYRSFGFTGKFYQIFRDYLTPILLKILPKLAKEGELPNSFYDTAITLTPKADKDTIK